jgi:hypothetical protein
MSRTTALSAAATLLLAAACSDPAAPTTDRRTPGIQRGGTGDPVASVSADFVAVLRPELRVHVTDQYDAWLPGAKIIITGPNGFSMTIADGGPGDQDGANNGQIRRVLGDPGAYWFCEVRPPTGFAMVIGGSFKCSPLFIAANGMIYLKRLEYTSPWKIVPEPPRVPPRSDR